MTHRHDTTQISRRKVLAGLGTIGVASAGAGFGSVAFLSDRERFADNYLEAGRLDLLVDYRATYSPWNYQPTDDDGTPYPVGDTMIDPETGEEGPMYVVGMAPDLRNEDGTVVDNETWSAASLLLDACRPLGDQFPLDVDGDDSPDVYRGDATVGGEDLENFSADFVDGPDGMLFRLDDIKPLDRGEATISLHVCDNPAYLWLQTLAGFDDENTRYEPEEEAGETDAGEWIDGELDDFVWVRAFYDPDCSNTLGEGEIVMYEGSLAGFVEYAAAGVAFDPLRDAGLRHGSEGRAARQVSTQATGDRLDVIVVGGNPTCADFGLTRAVKADDVPGTLGSTTYPTPAGDVELTITGLKDGSEALTFDWSADFGVDRVVVKAADSAHVYVYDEATGDSGLTTAYGNGISHISICYDSEGGDDPEDPVDPQDGEGICYGPGTHCIAVEWFLPDSAETADGMGFAQLPSDAAETDDPVNGEFPSLADELLATFEYRDVEEIDVNVIQSDATTFTLALGAVQCRHNTTNENPFGTGGDTDETA
jgi:Ca-activated chloride channel family protein